MNHHPAAALFPMLGEIELQELADDIRANGLHEPIWVWDDPERGPVLLDGRNRLAACKLAEMQPATRVYRGDDPVSFVISENLKRRHLTTGQKAAVAVAAEPLYAAEAAKRVGGRPRKDEEKPPADRPEVKKEARKRESRERAAKTAGTSGRSVARFKRIAKVKDLAAKVRAGDMTLDRAERIIRDRDAEQKRIEQARREAQAQPEPALVDIRHGDFREVLADLEGVDAVITDPPYSAEFLPLLSDLGAWADKVLAPDGVLAMLIGQTHLPEVYQLLEGHRPYRWTGCYLTPGASYLSHARKVHSNWKPLIVYGKGPRFADVIRAEGGDANAKAGHKWGQDYGAFHTIIERLTERGQTVVDPFMGSGTTLLAAHALGRHAIGCDTDPQSVATSRERIGGMGNG